MFDISDTVKEGVRRAMDRGVKFVTVHGNKAIMKAATDARGDHEKLQIFAITVLTSMDDGISKSLDMTMSRSGISSQCA
jgi:orotidine-5'-phosphate decarboxylase